ncbi:MAG: hypothetical protein IH591_11740 [Bacteroidales bacterium]|nr:hypothetical protein [Bacteroidales bacterium]
MRIWILILTVTIGILPYKMIGQEVSKDTRLLLLTGLVIDAKSGQHLPNVQYYSRLSGGGVTNSEGHFSLFASTGDTIEFRMVGYKPSLLPINQSHSAREYLVLVPMMTDTLEIGEVLVMPRIGDLRSVAEGASVNDIRQYENARGNINISVHQGLTGTSRLGDPSVNYEMLRKKQTYDAYEKGGIPSDRMLAVSPLLIVPALYLLINGMPEKPDAPQPQLSYKDIERLKNAYRELIYSKKK